MQSNSRASRHIGWTQGMQAATSSAQCRMNTLGKSNPITCRRVDVTLQNEYAQGKPWKSPSSLKFISAIQVRQSLEMSKCRGDIATDNLNSSVPSLYRRLLTGEGPELLNRRYTTPGTALGRTDDVLRSPVPACLKRKSEVPRMSSELMKSQ